MGSPLWSCFKRTKVNKIIGCLGERNYVRTYVDPTKHVKINLLMVTTRMGLRDALSVMFSCSGRV